MADKKTAQKIEDNLKAMLRDIDSKVARLWSGFDAIAKKNIEASLPLDAVPDGKCEVRNGALPVSVALRAVDYGAARVVLRAVPRMAEEFLVKDVKAMVAQAGTLAGLWALAKATGKKFPVIGDLIAILTGYTIQKTFYDRYQKLIVSVLGCSPSDFDKAPMRYALNERMGKTVERDNKDDRHVKKVRTRRP